MSRQRDKGSRFERSIADALANALGDDRIDRAPLRGAKDRGDIAGLRSPFGFPVVLECKNVQRVALAEWVGEVEVEKGNADSPAGFVVVKRRGTTDPLRQYVVGTVADLLALGWGMSGEGDTADDGPGRGR